MQSEFICADMDIIDPRTQITNITAFLIFNFMVVLFVKHGYDYMYGLALVNNDVVISK